MGSLSGLRSIYRRRTARGLIGHKRHKRHKEGFRNMPLSRLSVSIMPSQVIGLIALN